VRPRHGPVDAIGQRLDTAGRSPKPFLLKLHHLVHETGAFDADAITLWHPHLVKINQAGVTGVHADLFDLFADFDALAQLAFVAHGHHDQALVLVLGTIAGVDQHAHPVGLQAVGDPHLLASDHIVIAILARMAFDGCHVAARAGLAHAYAADRIAGNGRCQKLALELLTAKTRQRRRAHIGLHTNRHRDAAAVDMAQGFGHGDAI